jgi:hypothetical protein
MESCRGLRRRRRRTPPRRRRRRQSLRVTQREAGHVYHVRTQGRRDPESFHVRPRPHACAPSDNRLESTRSLLAKMAC